MSQPALDKMIAIADAFDRGAFVGNDKVDTDSVAAAVGLPPTTVSRLLKNDALGFTCLSEHRSVKVRNDRIYEYPPRIQLPDLKNVKQADARLIVEAIADHRLPRQFSTSLLYPRLGQSLNEGTIGTRGHLPKKLHRALSGLRFTSHRPEGYKKVVHPATWSPPAAWPRLFLEQRSLRRSGLRVSAIYRVTDTAAKVDLIIARAIEELDNLRVPYDKRGELKAAIQKIIKGAFNALIAQENADMEQDKRGRDTQDVDWPAVAKLSDLHLRNFAQIAERVATSETNDNPGAYALAWVQQNLPSAGTDAALGVNARQ